MVGLFELFRIFFQIGAFTLGGGYAMLTIVEQKIVSQKKYIEKDEFWDLIAVVQTLPGVFAINTALYVGHKLRGVWGAFFATLGAALPSFIAILLIAMCFAEFKDNEMVESIFKGIRPCVVALILSPGINLIKKNGLSLKTVWIPIVAAIAIWWFEISPVYIVTMVIIGALLWGINKDKTRKEEQA